jgi:hypothetical protein
MTIVAAENMIIHLRFIIMLLSLSTLSYLSGKKTLKSSCFLPSLSSILELLLVREPPNPHQSCPFISTRFVMSCSRLLSITKEKGQDGLVTLQSPLYSFMYALKSSEARRQYPKRLKMLFDYLKLEGILEENYFAK